jgi:hypothetical protein
VLESQLISRRKTTRMAALSALCTLPVSGVSRILGEILDHPDDEEASSAIVALTAVAQDAGDIEARRELESRRGRVRPGLQEEWAEAMARLEEA